jgi:hypothetical protein
MSQQIAAGGVKALLQKLEDFLNSTTQAIQADTHKSQLVFDGLVRQGGDGGRRACKALVIAMAAAAGGGMRGISKQCL